MVKSHFTALLLVLAACTSKEKSIKPQIKPLVEAVYASGYVVSKNEYQVFAQAEGYVLQKVANDGDEVKKGDPIYILESGQQSSRFELAQKNYNIALRNSSDQSPFLLEARTAMNNARTKMRYDSINHARFKNLVDRNATSRNEYDRARLAFESSTNEFELYRSRYEKLKNQLYLELEAAKSNLAITGNESGKYIVKSEADGKIFSTLKEVGELVRRGEAIAVIGDKNNFYLKLSVDELDIQRVKPGQQVVVTIDALPQKTYNATVDKIYPLVNRQQQALYVDATMNDPVPLFYSGLAVEANIIIRKKDKALVVPKAALVGNDSLKIETENGSKVIRITRGIETLDEVEILDGIDANTGVLTSAI